MTSRKTWAALFGAALAMGPLFARADQPSQLDMQKKIDQLEEKVRQLESRSSTAYTARDVDAAIESVVRDADRRSQLLADSGGFMAGWDNGFRIRSADGNYMLHPWFQMQFRYITNSRDGAKQGGQGDDTQNGFELRRMKFGFDGNVFTPNMTYLFLWQTDRKTGNPFLEDAWVKYKMDSGWFIKGGQLKNPLDHEQLVSSKYQLAVERSLVATKFVNGDDYVQGVTAGFDNNGAMRFEAAFTDGLLSQNENFQDFPTNKADWGTAGRLEYKVNGDWKDYDFISAEKCKKDLLVFGIAGDYTEMGHSAMFTHVADVQYSLPSGLSIYAAYLGRWTKSNPTAGDTDTYDVTGRLFVSYAMSNHWEPFFQYAYINFDSAALAPGAENTVHDFTVGVNYYWHSQAAKFTVDFSYLPNGSPVSDDGSGVLANDGRNEFLLRAQFQLLL